MMRRATPMGTALAFLLLAGAPGAQAADYTVIRMTQSVERPPAVVWAKVGPYCAIADWFKVNCQMLNGVQTGDNLVGSLRRLSGGFLPGNTDEVVVAATPWSYTYTQPTTKILYHGTLAVEPLGTGRSQLVYTVFFDPATIAPEAREADKARRTARFTEALKVMKAMAEAQ